MASHDIGEHLTRAKNSLDHDLSSLAAHASLAGGISELELEGVPPRKDMFLNFGQGPTSDDWERFDTHASRYAVISMVTSFEVYIERLYFLALLMTHSQELGVVITYNELSQYREAARKMARNSNPPGMLDLVKEELGIT